MRKSFLLISDEMVKESITPKECLEAVAEGFHLYAAGKTIEDNSSTIIADAQAGIHMYSAHVPVYGLGSKVLGAWELNPLKGKPYIQAYVMLMNDETGDLIALMEGHYLTAMRTAAATALGARSLCRSESQVLGIFGTGLQARTHLLCHLAAHPFDQALIWGRDPQQVERYLEEMRPQIKIPLISCNSPEEVCNKADVLSCTTRSRRPLFSSKSVRPGTHIGVAGPLRKEAIEIPLDIVQTNLLFVDNKEKFDNLWDDNNSPRVEAELGSVLLGDHTGRENDECITIFKPVGMAFEDVVSASVVLDNIRNSGYERLVHWE